ncbi:PQQ-dependent sugar dehydrogenase [Streptomyces sp. SBT349]|uniref:PQQ-dependent sugar dehydrogenase n=1 Tax=Streptomyces sp. SBT349 TaxID=1580539 RepID=UPI00066D5A7E|nr:PQQ-dependent sugar dehydrogenase [Streptomyces sp. SBT349]
MTRSYPGRRLRQLATCLLALTISLFMLPPISAADGGHQEPPVPADDRFEKVLLENNDLTQPMRIAVAPDGRLIYIERDGRVKVWDPREGASVVAGTVPVRVTGELGMVGLALAPDFERTGHLYLHFSRPDWDTSYVSRVARFTLADDNVLDLESETPVIDIPHPAGVGGGHSAGDLLMTEGGDLFIATGDNTNCCASRGFPGTDERPGQEDGDAQRTSANTNDLNGKVLRITPRREGGYSIPRGNLFAERRDREDRTRPEIYAMGFRNPFTLGDYDEETGALWVADYGPDAILPDPERGPAGHVRLFLMTEPGNYGWPYCTMDNQPYNDWNYVTDEPGPWFDCGSPVNDSPHNTGLVDLPPIEPATIYYTYDRQDYFPELYGGGAMAGPMYHYDEDSTSTTKFPEWFDGRRFLYDWTTDWVQTARFTGDLSAPRDMREFLPETDFAKPMDMEFGPDGSLYVLEYGNGWGSSNDDAGLYRIDYVEGNRAPLAVAEASADSGPLPLSVDFDASGSHDPDGDALSYAWDFDADGTTDATEATASHTFTTAGEFQPRLTVTDTGGRSATTGVPVVAGNTRPVVTIQTPADGTFSEFGEDIPFTVHVEDPDDARIDCGRIEVTYLLGHNEHGHPMAEATPGADCRGVLTPGRDAEHGPGAYVFHIVQATYTDTGGTGGAPALTAESDTVLHPRQYSAGTYPEGEGVGLYTGQLFVPDSGNWFMFPRIDVQDIDRLAMEFATGEAGVTFTVHADSPDGPVVARYDDLPDTGSTSVDDRVYQTFTAPVTDPGGVHDLYFVAEWPDGIQPELFVRDFTFQN